MCVCVCVCARVCACVCACVRACVRACMRARIYIHLHECGAKHNYQYESISSCVVAVH